MPGEEERHWTPQLHDYDEDASIFRKDPFAGVFSECLNAATATRSGSSDTFLLQRLKTTLEEPYHAEVMDNWLIFSLGYSVVINLPPEALAETQKLYLRVLYIRFQHDSDSRRREGEQLAYDALVEAQMKTIRKYCRPHDERHVPADFSWAEDIEDRNNLADLDVDWAVSDDSEFDDEMDLDFELDSDPESDLDNFEDDLVDDMEPDFPSQDFIPKVPKPSVLPSVLPHVSSTSNLNLLQRMQTWADNMHHYFLRRVPESTTHDDTQVLADATSMKEITRYNNPEFRKALKDSNLYSRMHEIARPGNLVETSHPSRTMSFRFHNWRITYSELICKWVPACITQAVYDELNITQSLPPEDPYYPNDEAAALHFLEFIASHPEMQPWAFNPMAVFILGLYRWIEGWNTERVYRSVMNLSMFDKKKFFKASDPLPFPSADPRFRAVIRETAHYRYFMHKLKDELLRPAPLNPTPVPSLVNPGAGASSDDDDDTELISSHEAGASAAAYRKGKKSDSGKRRLWKAAAKKKKAQAGVQQPPPPRAATGFKPSQGSKMPENLDDIDNPCPYCAGLPMRERCERFYRVKYHNRRNLIGGALTSAPVLDRLPPKPPPQPKNGEAPKPRPPPVYYHPYKDLKMRLIKFRPQVYERCGKDIVRLVWIHEDFSWEYVGGVRFKPFSEETLARLIYNHRLVVVRAIRRRAIMQMWAYGTMTATGSRQPSGGGKGDGYGPYACHRGDTVDDISAMAREGTV
ncbi:hypothetical protein R3P38DRAFT_2555019 [Favolaschia claudopus]|uniref:Uncharacterized protein n=1 Tax=Favolaschia claudopus TaxID=2862362 RepID=A0AAW0AD84_9AGAR